MIQKIKNFFLGSYEEFQKVAWPTKAQVISHTITVIIAAGIAMLIIALFDYALTQLVNYFLLT